MIKSQEYVPSTQESFAVMENIPGRMTICHAIRSGRAVIFEIDAELFARIAENILAQRAKNGTSPKSEGSRKARSSEPKLADL